MSNQSSSLGLIALLIALPLTAGAQTGASTPVATNNSSFMYLRTEAGVGMVNDVKVNGVATLGAKAGPAFTAALGFRTSGTTFIEAQIGHQNNKWKDISAGGLTIGGLLTGGASTTSFLAVTQFANKISDKSSFDVGLGLGTALIRADIGARGLGNYEKESDTRFMGQLSGHWRTTIAANTDFTLGYRFGYVDGPKFSSGLETNRVLTHVFSAGFRFAF